MFRMIWERYFLKEFLKIFFLFLFCFYGLYILIDYASHSGSIIGPFHLHPDAVVLYYVYVFSSRSEILIPVALLLAFVKTATTLNSRQELAALMAGGISQKLLLRPFLVFAVACTCLIYLNEQFLLPQALTRLRRLEAKTQKQKDQTGESLSVGQVFLEDESLLIFQSYDPAKERFFDVFWIPSLDRIYRMKYLTPYTTPPEGYLVDLLIRQPDGNLLQETAFPRLELPEIRFNREILQSAGIDSEVLSLSDLTGQFRTLKYDSSEKESRIMTVFYWRLAIPLLCLFAILVPAPFCIRFSRQLPLFLIYVCSLFGLIAFYMLTDAAQVMAKRQALDPFWAIWGPIGFVSAYAVHRYAKL